MDKWSDPLFEQVSSTFSSWTSHLTLFLHFFWWSTLPSANAFSTPSVSFNLVVPWMSPDILLFRSGEVTSFVLSDTMKTLDWGSTVGLKVLVTLPEDTFFWLFQHQIITIQSCNFPKMEGLWQTQQNVHVSKFFDGDSENGKFWDCWRATPSPVQMKDGHHCWKN